MHVFKDGDRKQSMKNCCHKNVLQIVQIAEVSSASTFTYAGIMASLCSGIQNQQNIKIAPKPFRHTQLV